MCWIFAIKTESRCAHTHSHTRPQSCVGLRAQIVLILTVLRTFLDTHQRHRRRDEDAHIHTRCSIIIIVSAGEESALLFVIIGGFEVRGKNFQGERSGWMGKRKKERARQKKTHQYVCDILVTFYRNCCSTPSHTCKKKKKKKKKKYSGNVLFSGWLPRFCLVCSAQRAKGALWLAGMALKTLQLRVEACSTS